MTNALNYCEIESDVSLTHTKHRPQIKNSFFPRKKGWKKGFARCCSLCCPTAVKSEFYFWQACSQKQKKENEKLNGKVIRLTSRTGEIFSFGTARIPLGKVNNCASRISCFIGNEK